jgi:hypothetical protein
LFYVGFEQVTGTNELLLTRKPWVSGAETTPFLAGMAKLHLRVHPGKGKQMRRNKHEQHATKT